MGLILEHLEDAIFMKNNVRFRVIGDMGRMPEAVQARLQECMRRTAGNDKMTLTIALSYSSRWELTEAMRRIADEVKGRPSAPLADYRRHGGVAPDNEFHARPGLADSDGRRMPHQQLPAVAMCLYGTLFL